MHGHMNVKLNWRSFFT